MKFIKSLKKFQNYLKIIKRNQTREKNKKHLKNYIGIDEKLNYFLSHFKVIAHDLNLRKRTCFFK